MNFFEHSNEYQAFTFFKIQSKRIYRSLLQRKKCKRKIKCRFVAAHRHI